jgi:hypothetical protein
MMLRDAFTVGLTALTLAGCAHTYRQGAGVALAVPAGNPVEADIEAGYRAYGETLERWGRWSADPLYSVHWCPGGVDATAFVPYRSEGHWGPAPGATPESASPYWVSDDSEASTWGDITMHHGWWIELDQSSASAMWCWVPGVEETSARVTWRVADGFVAWAPVPPLYDDSDEAVALPWAYELLGTLFDPDLARALLVDNPAAMAARAITAAEHAGWTSFFTRTSSKTKGPVASDVAAARHALSSGMTAHTLAGSTSGRPGPAVTSAAATTYTYSTKSSSRSTSSHTSSSSSGRSSSSKK